MSTTNRVTMAEFARLKACSKTSIFRAVEAGKVTLGDDGLIDPLAPDAMAYTPRRLARNIVAAPAATPKAKTRKRVKKTPAVASLDADLEMDSENEGQDGAPENLGRSKIQGEIAHRRVLTRLARLREMTLKKTLVPKAMVVQVIAHLNTAIRTNILNVPMSLAPRVRALAATGADVLVIRTAIEQELGRAIQNALEESIRSMEPLN